MTEITERASLLIREEIELAKAEIAQKVQSLVRGAVVGIAAGVFAIFGVVMFLDAIAWLLFEYLVPAWLGFMIVAVALFLFAALAGFLAYRAVKAGAPPTPDMAIDEARLLKETVGELGGPPPPPGPEGVPAPAAAQPPAGTEAPGGVSVEKDVNR